MNTMGKLLVDTYCQNCDDFVRGLPEGKGLNRCTECGAYASDDPDVCCAQHEVRESPYHSGECPMCEMERDRRAQMRHEMTRDPRVEPY